MADILQHLKKPTYSFTIPEEARAFPETDIKSLSLQPYTMAQELDALNAAKARGGSQEAFVYELVRRCTTKVNGAPVADFDWIDRCSPGVRMFCVRALNKATNPPAEAEETFLNSMTVEVG